MVCGDLELGAVGGEELACCGFAGEDTGREGPSDGQTLLHGRAVDKERTPVENAGRAIACTPSGVVRMRKLIFGTASGRE